MSPLNNNFLPSRYSVELILGFPNFYPSSPFHFHLLVRNWHYSRDKVPYSLIMDQNIKDANFNKSWNNIDFPLENTNNEGEKSNKCNQCKFASSLKSSLRRHLKIHSGDKSNKCNQCDYASFEAGHLRRHLKTHSGEKSNKCIQCDYFSSDAGHLRRHFFSERGVYCEAAFRCMDDK